MIIWKKKSINLQIHQLTITFNILIKQCHRIVWIAEKTQKVKIQKLYSQKTQEYCFYQNALSKEQEASGLLGSLGINTPLFKIRLVGPLLF